MIRVFYFLIRLIILTRRLDDWSFRSYIYTKKKRKKENIITEHALTNEAMVYNFIRRRITRTVIFRLPGTFSRWKAVRRKIGHDFLHQPTEKTSSYLSSTWKNSSLYRIK